MVKNPFAVNVSDLRGKPGAREQVSLAGALDGLKVSGSAVPDGAKAEFSGAVEAMEAGQGVVAVGIVSAEWVGDCRRCLGQARGRVDEHVREIFDVSPVEGETYPLEGELVNLEPLMRETVMLELPEAPLCSEDCRGLCPTCGVNHNETSCACEVDLVDPRWGALDALKEQ